MAGDQRLHARAGERPLHRRRHDRRLGVGRAQDLRLHVRDVPATLEPGLLPARRADRPQTTRNREAVLMLEDVADCPYKVIGKQPSTAASRRRRRRSSPTTSRPARLDRATPRGPTRRPPARGSAATRRRPPRAGEAARDDHERRQRPRHRPARGRGARRQRHRRRRDLDHLAGDHADRLRTLRAGLPVLPRARLERVGARTSSASACSSGRRRRRFQSSARRPTQRRLGAATVDLNQFAGQTVRIVIEAADASTASLVEAGVDDVRITKG